MYDLLKKIKAGGVKKIILDTDAYNEVDDQFAIAYAMYSPNIELLSLNAAPFFNALSTSPGDGMEKSYQEILKITKLADPEGKITPPIYRGSDRILTDKKTPVISDAAKNIVDTVNASDELIYVVAIGAITNVASALLMDPSINDKMAVVWLGGHAYSWPDTREFNLWGDVKAAQVVFASGVALVQIPCMGVCSALTVSVPELRAFIGGKNPLCDYLTENVASCSKDHFCFTRVIWDISAVAALANPGAVDMVVTSCPRITDEGYYAYDDGRHPYIYARHLHRDWIFRDTFTLLGKGIE